MNNNYFNTGNINKANNGGEKWIRKIMMLIFGLKKKQNYM